MYCITAKLNIYTLPNSLSKKEGYTLLVKCVSVFQEAQWLLEQHSHKRADLIPFHLCPLKQKQHLPAGWKILMNSVEICFTFSTRLLYYSFYSENY